MKRWYWIALVIWIFTGLPILLVGIGFSGGDLSLPTADTVEPWIIGWLIILYPIILFPFGREK
jgi:hypothetical protein